MGCDAPFRLLRGRAKAAIGGGEDETGRVNLGPTSLIPWPCHGAAGGASTIGNIWAARMVGEDHETFELIGPVWEVNTATRWQVFPFVRRKDGLELI